MMDSIFFYIDLGLNMYCYHRDEQFLVCHLFISLESSSYASVSCADMNRDLSSSLAMHGPIRLSDINIIFRKQDKPPAP